MSVGSDQYRQKCIDEHGDVCSVCGAEGDVDIHHIDGNRENNDLSNLTPLCPGCHRRIHRASYPGDNEQIQKLRELCRGGGEASDGSVSASSGGRKKRICLSLSQSVLKRLDQEENMSAVVEAELRERYEMGERND